MHSSRSGEFDTVRETLLGLRSEIEILLGRTADEAKPVDLELPIGRLSRADAMQMQNMASLNTRQLEQRLESVDEALRAIEEGRYGACRNCGDAIPTARLEVQPEARFCIDCQEMMEQGR